jgi:hypothetical protein
MEDGKSMKKKIVLVLSLTLFAVFQFSGSAFARRFQILDEISLLEHEECRFIEVRFNIPMRYIKHFPFEKGDDLRIKLGPLVINPTDESAQFTREYPGSVSADVADIADIIFEGDVAGGPFLAIYFHNTMSFRVWQGADFRSLVIAISAPENTPCDPLR